MSSSSVLVEHAYRQHARRVLATLIRLLGDFGLAEEAMQEAFAAALQQWPTQGVPENPSAWLISVGQRRGIDQICRRHEVTLFAAGPRRWHVAFGDGSRACHGVFLPHLQRS